MHRTRKLASWILVGLGLLFWTGALPAEAQSQSCTASASWATSPSPPPIRKLDPASVCQFYQFSWQAFLWLTQPDPKEGGALSFETYPQTQNVILPPPQDASTTNTTCVDRDERNGRTRLFLPRAAKMRDATTMDAFNQAKLNGVLVDQNDKVTFYEEFVDPYVFVPFVQACQLTTQHVCQTVPSAQSLRIPAGAIELKVSWRPIAANDPNYGRFYVLQNVTYQDPQTNQCVTGDMALVGFHLVYATPGHPEMVWATFEHIANAPNGPCLQGQTTTPPAGFTTWTYNNPKSTSCDGVNEWVTPPPKTGPYPITQAFRNWAYGTLPTDTTGNVQTIESLNSSVAGILPARSVWHNYFLVGAVWTAKGALPAIPPFVANSASNVQGSTVLANATMETFTQLPNVHNLPPATAPYADCFSCHNNNVSAPNPPLTPLYTVSHAFGKPGTTCPWQTPPAACLATQKPIPETHADLSPVGPVASH